MKVLSVALIKFALICLAASAHAQEQRNFNQNASRSNHTRLASSFNLSFSPVFSSSLNSNTDSLLFRGNGGGIKFGGDYFFGKTGIGFSSGFNSSSPSNSSINRFLQQSSMPPDQLLITKSNQQNMYLLLGPSIRFGNTVEMVLQAKGGMFINNGGLINIQQKGAVRSLYRNEQTNKSLYPGFQTGLNIQYKTRSDVWSFGLGADYLGTKTEVKNYDARRNGGVEGLGLSKNISDLVAGITIRYNILPARDHGSSMATGKRVIPTVNKREASTGTATARRVLPTVNKREIAIDEPGMNQALTQGCGPVTLKTTNADGSSVETVFSCISDAMDYARRIDAKKQKQWLPANFRTVSNTNVKGIISGVVEWSSASGNPAFGIISNTTRGGSTTMNSQTSSTRQTPQTTFGALVRLSAREAGSGMATGRRQYQPVFMENSSEVCNPCMISAKLSSVKSNPLYKDKGQSGNNPLYQGNQKLADVNCDGISDVSVLLIDIESGNVLASTKTEACGDFWFAHVPAGNYIVNVRGEMAIEKTYDLIIDKNNYDLEGLISFANDWAATTVSTSDSVMPQQKTGVSTSRSNIRTHKSALLSADTDGDGSPDEIWSPRSNISLYRVATGDIDGDGLADLVAGNSFNGGVYLLPGDPIPGLDVKLKTINESQINLTVDEDGKFSAASLRQGNYQLVITHTIYIDDKMIVDITANPTENSVTGESNLKQEKTVAAQNTGFLKAQNNNAVKTDRTELAMSLIDADLDGDGDFESRYLSVKGEIASISIMEGGKAKLVEKATSGVKQTMQTQVRLGNNTSSLPVKWISPESSARRVWGDPHVDEKDGSLKLGEGSGTVSRGKWRSSDATVKTIRCSNGTCRIVTASEKDYSEVSSVSLNSLSAFDAINNAVVWLEDDKGNIYKTATDTNGRVGLRGLPLGSSLKMKVNIGIDGSEDVILKYSNGDGTIHLMKAKHDIAMNAIRNLKG